MITIGIIGLVLLFFIFCGLGSLATKLDELTKEVKLINGQLNRQERVPGAKYF